MLEMLILEEVISLFIPWSYLVVERFISNTHWDTGLSNKKNIILNGISINNKKFGLSVTLTCVIAKTKTNNKYTKIYSDREHCDGEFLNKGTLYTYIVDDRWERHSVTRDLEFLKLCR